jgi:predicted acyl esterase
MLGISYFAMTQLEAAVEQPPHLRAILSVATIADLYEAVWHHGLLNASFVSPWLFATAMAAEHGPELWRGRFLDLVRRILANPRIHQRLEHLNGESALATMKEVLRGEYAAHPWDELWRAVVIDHPVRDAFWDRRNTLDALASVRIPVYLGCDWDNVPLHLPGTFSTWAALRDNPNVRMGLMPQHGLSWPWESLHVEGLAWFDHWLKGRDTGITDGPPIRYWMPVADEWRTASTWPPEDTGLQEWALGGDGVLAAGDGSHGDRDYVVLSAGLGRPPHTHPVAEPALLRWDSAPLQAALDVVGEIELVLVATCSGPEAAFIVVLQDVAPDDTTADLTAGYLRATLRELDEAASRPGAPVLPCRRAIAVPPGEPVTYRIPLVPNARRLAAGHRLRLVLAGDDQDVQVPAVLGFRHAPVGGAVRVTLHTGSRLLLPIAWGGS